MISWLQQIVGPEYALATFWGLIALAALLVFYVAYRLLTRMRSGTFVAGGRNRKARLAIMDATAVDTHRRLVLVRRDDVEHLILIGGHSDIVVERDIRLHGAARRPTMVGDHLEPTELAAPRHAPAPKPHAPAAPAVSSHRTNSAPAPTVRPATSHRTVERPLRPANSAPVKSSEDFDVDLLKELETALDIEDTAPQQPPAPKAKPSLDDEMAKLLGELSSHKR